MRAVLLVVVLSIGCSEREGPAKQQPGDAAPGQVRVAPPEQDEPDEPPAPSLSDLRLPDGVPGLTKSVVAQPRKSKAKRLNTRALAFHNRGEYDEAIDLYKKALAIDPGNVLARYNLSCAYNLSGRPDEGLALLQQFYDTDCDECRERLARASEDAEWHDRWDDPRFVELVAVAAGQATDRRWWLGQNPCPEGARLSGAVPPAGDEIWCSRPSGSRHGLASKWKDSKLAEQGEYVNGRREGAWLVFGEDGVLAESGQFLRGRRNGPWSEWAESGEQIADGRYKAGKKHGNWTHFSAAGAVENTELWRNGKLVTRDR